MDAFVELPTKPKAPPQPTTVVQVGAARYVTIELASTITGFSPVAIRTKIHRGVWVEDREWVRAPDGRVLIDLRGYERWAERGMG